MTMTSHIALLGDSIFDNRAYTSGDPDVLGHLRELLPAPWRASLYAVDGSATANLAEQLDRVAPDCSHVIISLGGNDALVNFDLLETPVGSMAEALALIAIRADHFEMSYARAVDRALALQRDTTVCTIYNGDFEVDQATVIRVALMPFNDAILRVAFERRVNVIDLRLVCTEAADYANPIEPSGRGGRKVAEAIIRSVGVVAGRSGHARAFA